MLPKQENKHPCIVILSGLRMFFCLVLMLFFIRKYFLTHNPKRYLYQYSKWDQNVQLIYTPMQDHENPPSILYVRSHH